eukprot:355906-Chlamydomonas_euryale.AAC.1
MGAVTVTVDSAAPQLSDDTHVGAGHLLPSRARLAERGRARQASLHENWLIDDVRTCAVLYAAMSMPWLLNVGDTYTTPEGDGVNGEGLPSRYWPTVPEGAQPVALIETVTNRLSE